MYQHMTKCGNTCVLKANYCKCMEMCPSEKNTFVYTFR